MQPLSPSTIRVMLVSSHQVVLWGLENIIAGKRPKMDVIAKASNAADALQLVRAKQPDVLLFDLCLGNEKSVDLLPDLVKDGRIRVLIFTAMSDQQNTIDRMVLNGASGVVYKEEPILNILQAIEKIHAGELWLNRAITSRILSKSLHSRRKASVSPDNGESATLTPRELSIIKAFAVAAGAPNKRIAEMLCIGEQTLRNQLTSIFRKLEIGNRYELFMFAKLHHSLNLGNSPAA